MEKETCLEGNNFFRHFNFILTCMWYNGSLNFAYVSVTSTSYTGNPRFVSWLRGTDFVEGRFYFLVKLIKFSLGFPYSRVRNWLVHDGLKCTCQLQVQISNTKFRRNSDSSFRDETCGRADRHDSPICGHCMHFVQRTHTESVYLINQYLMYVVP